MAPPNGYVAPLKYWANGNGITASYFCPITSRIL